MSDERPLVTNSLQSFDEPGVLGSLVGRPDEVSDLRIQEPLFDRGENLVGGLVISAPPWLRMPWEDGFRRYRARASPPVERGTEELRWVVASDEAGFELKARVRDLLASLGADVSDLGPMLSTPVDYPDYAAAVGRALQAGDAHRGILLCGHGVGASVAANKMRGVRAGLCHEIGSVLQAVEHDDMNVLVLPAQLVEPRRVEELVQAFLSARFAGAVRHRRCLEKIRTMEEMAARTRPARTRPGG